MRISLRWKITLALLLLAIGPLVVATLVVVDRNAELLERSAREYRLATADNVVREVRSRVAGARTELLQVGAALARVDVPAADRMRVAEAVLRGAEWIPLVRIFSRDGAHIDTMRTEAAGPTPPETLDEGLRNIAAAEGSVFFGVTGSSDAPYLPVLVPITRPDNGELYAFLWSAIELKTLSEVVADTSARRFGDNEDRVYVIDRQLQLVAHGDPARRMASMADDPALPDLEPGSNHLTRNNALSVEFARAGRPFLGALVPIPELGWGVGVEQSRDEAYEAVATTRQTGWRVGAAAVLVAVVFGLLIGRGLAAPILSLVGAARKLASGAFDTRVSVRARDEVGDLAGAFNTMAEDLGNYEIRVVEETRIRSNLSRYLSGDVVDSIVAQKTDLKLGGERREVTVLFADIVSFTPMAEQHDAEHIVSILNELFTFMTEIVHRNGGIIDKFMGDCVMAVFGTPTAHPDDAARAVQSADEMLQWLEVGNARWKKELGAELKLAIGISTGVVLAGNIGSEKRMEYTVIGDAVNLAARLESLAKAGQVLLSEHTAKRLDDEFELTSIGTRQVKGKSEEVEVFALQR